MNTFCVNPARHRTHRPSQAQSQQYHQRPQQRRPQPHHHQPADISSFAYEPPPPPPPPPLSSQQSVASPSPAHASTPHPGAAPQHWQPQPQRGYQMGGGANPDPPAGVTTYTTAPTGATARGNARPAMRSWDDVSRQRGKGRHASAGIGRPAAAAGEPSGNEWVLGRMRQQGEDGSSGSRFEARDENGGHAGARGGSSFVKTFDGCGGSASGRGGYGARGAGGGGTTSSFFGGRGGGSSEGQVRQNFLRSTAKNEGRMLSGAKDSACFLVSRMCKPYLMSGQRKS